LPAEAPVRDRLQPARFLRFRLLQRQRAQALLHFRERPQNRPQFSVLIQPGLETLKLVLR
jgi:hypothetical protein